MFSAHLFENGIRALQAAPERQIARVAGTGDHDEHESEKSAHLGVR